MNTAARFFQQGALSRDWVVSVLLTRSQVAIVLLIAATLLSALSVVYVTYNARNLHANLQRTLAERNHLHVQWSQLLLEKSTWTMQARVQTIAEEELDMVMPNTKSIVVVNE